MNFGTARFLLALGLSMLAGCSTLKGMPDGDPIAKQTYEQSTTLPNALSYAGSIRDAYAKRSSDLRMDERLNGLTVIGLGLIGGDLVARSVSPNASLGLGLTSFGLYTSNGWANPRTERELYAEGARAMHCAITVMDPLRPAYAQLGALQQGAVNLNAQANALDSMLVGLDSNETPRVVEARNAVKKARASATAATIAAGYLSSAGPSLVNAVKGMRIDVEAQMTQGVPDYATLIASLIQQKVLPATAPLSLPNPKVKAADDTLGLIQPTAALEALTSSVDQFVALANQRPSTADLQACHVDMAAAGITMKVEPATVSLKAGDHTVALISGGSPPYTVTAIADASSLDQLTFDVASTGILTVTAKSTATAGTYTIYIVDRGNGRATLLLTISSTGAPTPPQNQPQPSQQVNGAQTQAPTKPCPNPDPAITDLQSGLRTLGFSPVQVDPANPEKSVVEADGCLGKITLAALRQFYIKQGQTQVEPNQDKLVQEGEGDVKAAVAEKAKGAQKDVKTTPGAKPALGVKQDPAADPAKPAAPGAAASAAVHVKQ